MSLSCFFDLTFFGGDFVVDVEVVSSFIVDDVLLVVEASFLSVLGVSKMGKRGL